MGGRLGRWRRVRGFRGGRRSGIGCRGFEILMIDDGDDDGKGGGELVLRGRMST